MTGGVVNEWVYNGCATAHGEGAAAVGQKATKQIWPLDNVEVRAVVRLRSSNAGAEVGVCHEFDFVPTCGLAEVQLVQMRQQHLEPQQELIAGLGRDAHTTRSNHQYEDNTLFLYGFCVPGIFG